MLTNRQFKMIELFNSKKMILLVLGLVALCIVIIVLEGFLTDDHLWHPLYPAKGHRWDPQKHNLPSVLNQQLSSKDAIKANLNNSINQINSSDQLIANKQKLESISFCWLHESHVLVSPCSECSSKDKEEHSDACNNTGYMELIRCQTSGLIARSCVRSAPSSSHFTIFHLLMAIVSGVGYLSITVRRKQLDAKMYERFRRQLQSGV